MTIMPGEYSIEVERCVRAVSDWYDKAMDELENQAKRARGDDRRQIRQCIDRTRERLVQRLKDGAISPSEIFASGVVDAVTVWFLTNLRRKEDVRDAYMRIAQDASSEGLELPPGLTPKLEPDFSTLPDPSWLALEIDFRLQTPWYSKDDRPFHVLDNPVRKDRVYGVPFMAGTSWKGLLRWACRMRSLERRKDRVVLHLFGSEKGDDICFRQGALVFYPTWFSKVGFEVINPHSRKTRAGTQPIYYEVVPAGTKGTLRLLYAPVPGAAARDQVKPEEAIEHLLDAIEALLKTYGISAKRTVGWGASEIVQWCAHKKGCISIRKDSLNEFKEAVRSWLHVQGGQP